METLRQVDRTWTELKADPQGTPYLREAHGSAIFTIVRGSMSLCAYIGVPDDHPFAKFEDEDLGLCPHGGVTYKGKADFLGIPGYYWFGWDYAHCGDQFLWDLPARAENREWLVEDVVCDSREVVATFIGHMMLESLI